MEAKVKVVLKFYPHQKVKFVDLIIDAQKEEALLKTKGTSDEAGAEALSAPED